MVNRSKSDAPGRSKSQTKTGTRLLKRKRDEEELVTLQKGVDELDLKSLEIKDFAKLPLSEPTTKGLRASHFETLTEIQAKAIPTALKGQDILGAAKTGSGKTLAFLVPVLETLYRAQWTELDGLGALIVSPTRELSIQIFDVLRKIGRYHSFSAGLIIGGNDLRQEQALGRMNILVCTPGRMLQHLDQTAGVNVDGLLMLVLDEADRIMDMGFQRDVDALVEHLPKSRQTLLFSATQSKKVSDLARLSLKDPEYISVHEAAASATPSNLQQHYIITPLREKLDTLYGFIRSNLKSKIIVFFSSGKQVRFAYEALRHLQPGISLLHLHGKQKQLARLEVTRRFSRAKYSCLFATDVVARGVDFPAVDWVIQVDAPEDAETYIHRVGRTARYEQTGRAVLFLDPSEEAGFVKRLEQKKVPIQKVHVKEKKKQSITNQLQNMCFQRPDLKYLGQKAFISYAKSVYIQKDKEVFKFDSVDLDGFAASMGLPGTPQVKFQKGEDVKRLKNASRANISSGSDTDSDGDGGRKSKKDEVRTKYQKMAERTNQDVLSSHYSKLIEDEKAEGDDGDQDFLSVKRVLNTNELDDAADERIGTKVIDMGGQQLIIDSNRREKLLKSKKKLLKFKDKGTRLVFDDEGNAHQLYELQDEDEFRKEGPVEELRQRFVEDEAERVREADIEDRMLAKQKRKEKRLKQKARERGEDGPSEMPRLGGAEDGEEGEDPLALLRSLPIAGDGDSDDAEPPKKKTKKWFQNDSDDEDEPGSAKRKVVEIDREPENLEDWEALAEKLINKN